MDYHPVPVAPGPPPLLGLPAASAAHAGHGHGHHPSLAHAAPHHTLHTLQTLVADDAASAASRWTHYHHFWRQHHAHHNAKTSGKDGPEEKKDDGELWCNVEAQAAFLGPNLWDKTYDADLKYVDLDEFLSENGIPVEGLPGTQHLKQAQAQQQAAQAQAQQPQPLGPHPQQPAPPAPHPQQHPHPHQHPHPAGAAVVAVAPGPAPSLELVGKRDPSSLDLVAKRERSPSPCEPRTPDTETLNPPSPADSTLSLASSGRDFDPRTRAFSDEELKPQPMIKKSRKQFVPDDMKDEKYWARRRKNNLAAKRSRDARRVKENQIALRAGFLEKENMNLRQELDRLKKENMLLRDKLSKFTEV